MATLLSIGDFSRLTYLSVKALRHYHEVGLLVPAEIDGSTGYRFYAAAQAPTAQLIRRLRDMEMPLDEIRAVLTAADREDRDRVIVDHLRRMEEQLEQTQATVASLRVLLEGGGSAPSIDVRHLEPVRALSTRAVVAWDDTETWLHDVLSDLRRELGAEPRIAPDGALYTAEYFEQHVGEVIAFVPVAAGPEAIDGGPVAVTVHEGSFADLDRAYAALGAHVAERGIGRPGPIREHYVISALDGVPDGELVTEVCWPVAAG